MRGNENNSKSVGSKKTHQYLKALGYVFPQTLADFKKIDAEASKAKISKPASFKDPKTFIGRKQNRYQINQQVDTSYENNLAQAAREGGVITDEIKKQMELDKKASKRKKNADEI